VLENFLSDLMGSSPEGEDWLGSGRLLRGEIMVHEMEFGLPIEDFYVKCWRYLYMR
jgi:hypothetical protein